MNLQFLKRIFGKSKSKSAPDVHSTSLHDIKTGGKPVIVKAKKSRSSK